MVFMFILEITLYVILNVNKNILKELPNAKDKFKRMLTRYGLRNILNDVVITNRANTDLYKTKRYDQVPYRSEHPLLIGHNRRVLYHVIGKTERSIDN